MGYRFIEHNAEQLGLNGFELMFVFSFYFYKNYLIIVISSYS